MTASPPLSQRRRSRPSRGGVVLFLLVLAGAGAWGGGAEIAGGCAGLVALGGGHGAGCAGLAG